MQGINSIIHEIRIQRDLVSDQFKYKIFAKKYCNKFLGVSCLTLSDLSSSFTYFIKSAIAGWRCLLSDKIPIKINIIRHHYPFAKFLRDRSRWGNFKYNFVTLYLPGEDRFSNITVILSASIIIGRLI
jgi:hypothetical protein